MVMKPIDTLSSEMYGVRTYTPSGIIQMDSGKSALMIDSVVTGTINAAPGALVSNTYTFPAPPGGKVRYFFLNEINAGYGNTQATGYMPDNLTLYWLDATANGSTSVTIRNYLAGTAASPTFSRNFGFKIFSGYLR
jgi:hypothetical protein